MITASRYSAISRMLNYEAFCSSHRIPMFPIVGSIVALWTYHQASQSERFYNSEVSKLNMARKTTEGVWRGKRDYGEAAMEVVSCRALWEFLTERREWNKTVWKREKSFSKKDKGKGKAEAKEVAQRKNEAPSHSTNAKTSRPSHASYSKVNHRLFDSPGPSKRAREPSPQGRLPPPQRPPKLSRHSTIAESFLPPHQSATPSSRPRVLPPSARPAPRPNPPSSGPLTVLQLGHLLAALSPSLKRFAPFFHRSGLAQRESVIAFLLLSEARMAAVLEEPVMAELPVLQRKLSLKAMARLRANGWAERS